MASAQELVQSCSNVFTLPEIYIRVRDVVDDHESTMDDLADALKIYEKHRSPRAARAAQR